MTVHSYNLYTEKIIYWIGYHSYSKMHWDTEAVEILAACDGDVSEAIVQLSFSIRRFHITFQDAVIKPGNVLYDLVDIAFVSVDWDAVAGHIYANLPKA